VTVAGASYDVQAIFYVLPVLRMTACVHNMGHMARGVDDIGTTWAPFKKNYSPHNISGTSEVRKFKLSKQNDCGNQRMRNKLSTNGVCSGSRDLGKQKLVTNNNNNNNNHNNNNNNNNN